MIDWGRPFWELDVTTGRTLIQRALVTHIITSRYGVPLMVERGGGLVVEVTDGDTVQYRGNLVYDLIKVGVIRRALAMAEDFAKRDLPVTALALTPGFLRSEEMLERFGVSEANWLDGAERDPYFAGSETPHFIGRVVVALATDPQVSAKAGQALATWHLSRAYGFSDVDGRQPHWGEFYEERHETATQ